ncbi:MAG: Holliday junction resolvase RuvX [Lentisphaerae bacterium]|nr:Holliday junction resolvase RuvX [Lentisphaerota bacterium]
MARWLGIDVGEKRIGVAVSDEAEILAFPLAVLTVTGEADAERQLRILCEEKKPAGLVVGIPLQMNGLRGPASEKTLAFARRLEERLRLPVTMVDERLSTRQVERMLIESDVRRADRKRVIDKLAAQQILQNFLDARQEKRSGDERPENA